MYIYLELFPFLDLYVSLFSAWSSLSFQKYCDILLDINYIYICYFIYFFGVGF